MDELIIRVKDYTEYPGPRYISLGEHSGEDFYHKTLNAAFAEAYKSERKLIVNLDGTAGYASSFLDEAFGNLVYDFGLDVVKVWLSIESISEPDWVDLIQTRTYVEWDRRKAGQYKPKVTAAHQSHYIIEQGVLTKKNS